MIKIRIVNEVRDIESIDESWIIQQINRRRADGQNVFIQVIIHKGAVNMVLSTPNAPSSGTDNRPPNQAEQNIFDLWDRCGLKTSDFTGDLIIKFLKQLHGYF